MVCSMPVLLVTVTSTIVPTLTSVEPVIVGVGSLVRSIGSMTMAGGVVSTSPVSVAVALFPALSLTVALTVKLPSASAVGTSTE